MLLTGLIIMYGIVAVLFTLLFLVALFTNPDRTISGFKSVVVSLYCGVLWLPLVIWVICSVYFEDRF